MSELRVQTEELRRQAKTLRDIGDDTAVAAKYVNTHLSLTWEDSMAWQTVDDKAREVRDALTTALDDLKTVLAGSGVSLRSAAAYYDETDAEIESKADARIEAISGLDDGGLR